MCGICGVISLDGASRPDRDLLERMSATLTHRGPDSSGAVVVDGGGLAARRLSIIDLPGGDQPVANEDESVWLVQNGEIYNYEELREDLLGRGHRFRSRGDTEILVHLYEEHGPAFAERLRGMFAIAVWDTRRRRVVLARDRFGIKPLYWSHHGGRLSFGSELPALAAQPGFSRQIDPRALEAYLAFNSVPGPLSIYEAASKLPPGSVLVGEGGGVEVSRYARPGPPPAAEQAGGSARELADRLLGVFRESIRAHLVADVPVGVMLSGGVDSGAIAALASEEAGYRVKTFSIGFEEESFNELERARQVAERYGTDHHELVVRPDAAEALPRLAATFDEPFGDSSALPTYLVSELAAGSVKVALSGEGGDELFGGYYTYVADLLARYTWPLAALARPIAERLPSSDRKVSFDYRAKRFTRAAALPPLERHLAWKEIFGEAQRADLRAGEAIGWDPFGLYRERFAETAGAEALARLQDADLGVYLVDDLLVKTDRSSMAHSLEARVPFLDQEVADFALALPRRLRVRGLAKKRLLRRALSPLLPRAVSRGPKQGFSIPMAAWLRGPLEPLAREVLAEGNLRRQGLIDPAAAAAVLDRHVSRREDLSRQIWGLMALTLWADSHGVV